MLRNKTREPNKALISTDTVPHGRADLQHTGGQGHALDLRTMAKIERSSLCWVQCICEER
jgi:hypothetical protein